MEHYELRQPEGRAPRVLMVYPKIPDTYWSFKYALPFIKKKAVMPPLGLLTVAALLPSDWDCSIIDMNVDPLNDSDILSADMVMLSAMIVQKDSFAAVASRCHELGVPVIAGGPYPTSSWQEIGNVDCFILNEGEVTIPEFLQDFEAGTVKRVYENPARPDITSAPVPRFDILDMSVYDTLPLQYSRGCPFDCEFCDIVHLFGRNPRTKTPEQFIREMDAAYATGFHGAMFIVDDNFIGNKKHVKGLLRAIIPWQKKRGYPYDLSTEASMNLAEDEELMDLMVDAGFVMVFLGIETPVAESLEGAGKSQNLKRSILSSVRTIQEKGIEVTGGFVIGFDSDPENIFDLQIDFIRQLAVPTAMVGLLMALPHTRLHKRLSGEGRIRSSSGGNNTHSMELNFLPALPEETLRDGYLRVLKTIYEPRNYFDRCLDLLGRFPPAKDMNKKRKVRKIALRELLAFPRSLFRQSFSFYGKEYLRYFFKSARRYPGRLVEIITYAIQGHHFIMITRDILAKSADSGRGGSYEKEGKRDRISLPLKKQTI